MGPRNSAAVVFTDPDSTVDTLAKTKTKKSTPYNRNFNMHLTDHGVHDPCSSEEPDLEDLRAALRLPRQDLSTSQFSQDAFKSFAMSDGLAKDEQDVLASVIPTILGPNLANRSCGRNTCFLNLEPLTDGTIAPPKPDIYHGSDPRQLARSVRAELGSYIVPSTMEDKPAVPNFFLEVKGPSGTPAVATLQARYDGAMGSRAMHKLQNYGVEKPQYDAQPYTYSSTYQCGTLNLYAHHITAPSGEGGQPEYHMNLVGGFNLKGSREQFVEGASALRNALDLAEQHRREFIGNANARAPKTETAAEREAETAPVEGSADGSPHVDEGEGEGEDGDGDGDEEDEENGWAGSSRSSQSSPGAGLPTSIISSRSSGRSRVKRQRSPCAGAAEGRVSKTRSRAVRKAQSSAPTL
jgi:hypothetical protein